MAAFPLPRETFPAIKFAAAQSADFAACRDRLLGATMDARRAFRDKYKLRLDTRVWKVLKKASHKSSSSSFTVYLPRRKALIPRPLSSPTCSPILVGAGAITGSSLEDVMLGLTSSTTSAMRFAAAYMHGKDVLDARVLATLQAPTATEPFASLGCKWMVKGPSFAMKNFVRPRDFVYLESSGLRVDDRGHRVGHVLMHSVDLAGCRSLKASHGIVRGALSFCFLFSDSLARPGSVDIFFKGFVDPRGGVTERLALAAAAGSIMACLNAPLCARMKKYSWMAREMRSHSTSSLSETPTQASASEISDEEAPVRDGCCTVCDVGFSAFTVSLACDICRFDVCSSCVQTVVMASSTSAAQEHLSFCHHCVNAVEKLDSTRVARDDANYTLRALQQLSGVTYNSSGEMVLDGVLEKCSERIKLEPLKKRCQSVGAPPLEGRGLRGESRRSNIV